MQRTPSENGRGSLHAAILWRRLFARVAWLKQARQFVRNGIEGADECRRNPTSRSCIGILDRSERRADQQFDRLRAVPKGFGRSPAGREVITILNEVNQRGKSELPKVERHKPGPSPKGAIGDLLRVLLKAVADKHGVAPRIIASSDDLNQLVLEDEADIPALKGWRREIFGEKALALKEGKLALAATPKGVREIEIRSSDN